MVRLKEFVNLVRFLVIQLKLTQRVLPPLQDMLHTSVEHVQCLNKKWTEGLEWSFDTLYGNSDLTHYAYWKSTD